MVTIGFDCSRLEPASVEFVVVSDTHHIHDPEMYGESDSVTATVARSWSARADSALRLANALGKPLLFHVGDLTQEYPGHPSYDVGQRSSRDRVAATGFHAHYTAGNMDIGDKPDPTSPAGWVEPSFLRDHEGFYGRSYYSLSRDGVHFVVLNSQLMNSALAVAAEQQAWLEDDLERHRGERVVVFLHLPPFVVDADEPGLGAYDTLSEPARGWLLGLFDTYDVEAVFSGHIHFRMFNRVRGTRLYTVPSTTLTRPGFCELFPVMPGERGWGDLPKLGLFLVRVLDDRIDVHLVRTDGDQTTYAAADPDWEGPRRIVTRVSRGLRHSPLGAYLRQPLAASTPGAVVYPNLVRHRMRDDYPLMAAVELGIGHVRFPLEDLDDARQRERLEILRDEGVALTATTIRWSDETSRDLPAIDCLELQLAGRMHPDDGDDALAARARRGGIAVAWAPIVMDREGTVHMRPRVGYRLDELAELDAWLAERDRTLERVVVLPAERPWAAVRALAATPLAAIEALDLVVPLGVDHERNVPLVAEAIVAAAILPGCRLIVDPLQELDRSAALMGGLLDRLSNPRPAFHVVRLMNTLLYASAGAYEPLADEADGVYGVQRGEARRWVITGDAPADALGALARQSGPEGRLHVVDLVAGEGWPVEAARLAELTIGGPGSALMVCRG